VYENMMKNRKKGQAALEFLTTYGWAFLVILVMIGALAYFGVLDPSRFISEGCQLPGAITCVAGSISGTDSTVSLGLKNNMMDDATITLISLSSEDGSCGTTALTGDANAGSSVSLGSTSLTTTACLGTSATENVGEKKKFDLTVSYTKDDAASVTLVAAGTMVATIQ